MVAAIAVIAGGLIVPTSAASEAAAFLVCQPTNGAPSITRLSNGIDLKGYYIEQYDPDGWRVYASFDRGLAAAPAVAC